MKKNRKIIGLILLICIAVWVFILFIGKSNEPEAREALENYLSAVKDGNHAAAYRLVSDFDKKSITEEEFVEWRKSVDKIVQKKSFTIAKKTDRFKNYEYMGTLFEDAYGFDAGWEQEYIAGTETTDYDKDNFKIMVVKEKGTYKIALFLTDLKERTDKYKKNEGF